MYICTAPILKRTFLEIRARHAGLALLVVLSLLGHGDALFGRGKGGGGGGGAVVSGKNSKAKANAKAAAKIDPEALQAAASQVSASVHASWVLWSNCLVLALFPLWVGRVRVGVVLSIRGQFLFPGGLLLSPPDKHIWHEIYSPSL